MGAGGEATAWSLSWGSCLSPCVDPPPRARGTDLTDSLRPRGSVPPVGRSCWQPEVGQKSGEDLGPRSQQLMPEPTPPPSTPREAEFAFCLEARSHPQSLSASLSMGSIPPGTAGEWARAVCPSCLIFSHSKPLDSPWCTACSSTLNPCSVSGADLPPEGLWQGSEHDSRLAS